MLWFRYDDKTNVAAHVCFVYQSLRKRGLVKDDDEWTPFLDKNLNEALQKGDPHEFCWSLLIAMGIGGAPDVPLDQREELGVPMQEWSNCHAPDKEAA